MLLNMGQHNSVHKPRRRSLRSPFLTKRNHKSSLSHTFSLSNDEQKIEQLNINLATEEELMTLSGISREIARSIVKHRQVIGRFRKVEDLALVAGIGAEKLDKIRGEICIKMNSCSSSRAQSFDSLKSTDTKSSTKLIDINKASVFELQCVTAMTQEMAANIVHYRNKKGPFKKVDDLLKVKTVSLLRFSNMCHYLTIDSEDQNSNLSRTTSASEVIPNGMTNGNISNGAGTPMKHRKTSSAPVKLHIANGLPSPSSLGDIFELLSAYSYRPIPEEDFRYSRNGKDAFRIATWNLHEFSYDKAQNLGVREVICRTILENRWSIVCVQEVLEEEALQLICDELNTPRLRKVAEVRSNSHEWHCKVLNSHLGFIYDTHNGGIGLEMVSILKHTNADNYSLAVAEFSLSLLNIQVLNIDVRESVNINILEEQLTTLTSKYSHLIVLGNFTNVVATEQYREIGVLQLVLPLHTNTGCASIKNKYSDNIFLTSSTKLLLTGFWSIVRQGLTHLAIPNGWSWGGPVSPHCPLWTELYLNPPLQNGF